MADAPAAASKSLRMSYRIARGEMGVLTFEPYKSHLLKYWRFRTPEVAENSSDDLWSAFIRYDAANDFVGMDMTRKFIQMGMTRAKRYANYKGGRKYRVPASKLADGEERERLEKSHAHQGREEKLEASNIFREVLEKCKTHQGYREKRTEFLKEQKEWDDSQGEAKLGVKRKVEASQHSARIKSKNKVASEEPE